MDLVSHWPYVTYNSGISTYELTALEREMGLRSAGVWYTLPLTEHYPILDTGVCPELIPIMGSQPACDWQ